MTREEFIKFFEAKLQEMLAVCKDKNSDYTDKDEDPFANFSRVKALGICSAEQGFLTRMTDKLCRITSFVNSGALKVKEESVHDTLLDLANYSILLSAYITAQNNIKDVNK